MTNAFNPDEFLLGKLEILSIMDAITARWKKSNVAKLKNAKYIIGIEAMKVGIRLTSEDVIKQIWLDILMGFNELIKLNQDCRLKKEYPSMADMLEIVHDKIASGELYDPNRK